MLLENLIFFKKYQNLLGSTVFSHYFSSSTLGHDRDSECFCKMTHYSEKIMNHFDIFGNSGDATRFGKFQNAKNLETQAFTIGFGLYFIDFNTLF